MDKSDHRVVLHRLPAVWPVAVATILCSAVNGVPTEGNQPAQRPHILFILADDLGWGDVGFHGSQIKTPALDALAASGARLEKFYVQPVCTPTRAALLTGRYPMRHGLQVEVVRPWAQYGLPLEERTLPQAIREAGYETAICGKWHLGHYRPAYLPTRRGFDHQYGPYNGALDYFTHVRDGGHDWHRDDLACYDEGYSTFLLADEAVRLIRRHNPQKPLFLYLPFNAVHSPFQAPEEYIEPYAPMEQPRRTYAGMVTAMDEAIGQVVAALDEKQMRPNTLIVFASDNGGPAPGRISSNGPYREGKGTLYEGGVRVAALAAWEGHIPPGSVVEESLHIVDWYPTLLKLAGAKLDQTLPLDGCDAWPTIAEGKPSPHEEILINAAPVSGAMVRGQWQRVPASGAMLAGQWKLVINGLAATGEAQAPPAQSRAEQQNSHELVELFDLARDPYEKKNLAEKHPDKVRQLRARYETLARQGVPPKFQPMSSRFRSPKVWGENP